MSRSLLGPAVLVLLVAAAARAQDVHVVDDDAGPGVDFSSVAAAVSAAGEGDTILVRAGNYAGATIVAKSLAISADPDGAEVVIEGSMSIEQLSEDQFVSVSGLSIDASTNDFPLHGLLIEDNLGHVWVEDCVISGTDYPGPLSNGSGPGVSAENAARVTLVRCDVFGGTGGPFTGIGFVGLRVIGSHVRLFDSRLFGGSTVCDVSMGCPGSSAPGAIMMGGGTAYFEGSEIRAGDPGLWCPGAPMPCQPGGVGPALTLYSGNPVVTFFDTTMPLGDPPILAFVGTTVTLPGSSRDMTLTSPVRSGQPLTLEFTGAPGDLAWVFAGLAPAGIPAPQFKGALLVGEPSLLLLLGSLPASGVLTLTAPAASFPPALDSLQVAVQAAFAAGGGAILSDPARLILLQPGL